MAYFYVKSGLTGTGDQGRYASQQTGAFPTTTGGYDNIVAAFGATTPPAHGDFICVSDSHSHSYSANSTYTAPDNAGVGVTIMSVSDTNCDTYSRGAAESSSDGFDISLDGYLKILGLDFAVGDDLICSGQQDVILYDCTSTISAIGDRTLNVSDAPVRCINCTFNFNAVNAGAINLGGSGDLSFINCTFATDSSYASEVIQMSGFEGSRASFVGCDFSGLSSSYLISSTGLASTNYPKLYTLKNCKIPSLTDWISTAPANLGHEIIVTGTSSTSGPQEYQYCYINGSGRAEDDTAIYRTGSTAFPGGQKISLKVTTVTDTSEVRPFVFDLPTRYADLSSASTDTVTVYFLSADSLDDSDIFCSITYPDGTNEHTPNNFLSVTDAFDPFRSAGSLTTNTESWNGYTSQNRYEISLDTSVDAGAECVPIIRVYVTKASATIYMCPTIGLS